MFTQPDRRRGVGGEKREGKEEGGRARGREVMRMTQGRSSWRGGQKAARGTALAELVSMRPYIRAAKDAANPRMGPAIAMSNMCERFLG